MDPDPGDPKTCGSCGSGSPTLQQTMAKVVIKQFYYRKITLGQLSILLSSNTTPLVVLVVWFGISAKEEKGACFPRL
jgi:hypothetical protein